MAHPLMLLPSLALLTTLATAQSTGAWEVLGSAGISDADVWCCQIAFDASDAPHVAYQDHSLGPNPASVKRFKDGTWSYVGAKGTASVGTAWYNHLAFDGAGTLYVASRDYGVSSKLNVRRAPGGSPTTWSNVGAAGTSTGQAHYTHLVVGEDNSVYVAYSDADKQNKATVRRSANGAWSTLGPAGFTGGSASYTSLAIGRDGTPYIAFADGAYPSSSGDGKVTVLRYVAGLGAWQLVGTPGFTSTGGLNLRLALDRDDVPHVVYQEYHQRLVVMKFNGSQWVKLGTSASGSDRPVLETESWRQWCSIDFDSQNTPYVAYQLFDQGRKAAVRKFVGQSWVAVGAIGFSPGSADYMAMAIDNYDMPHVVFRDSAAGGRATVMRFAPSPYTYCAGITSSIGCQPQITTSGVPSVSDESPFLIGASSIINQRTGFLLYSLRPDNQPFGNGFFCLKTPWKRTSLQNSGGSVSGTNCTGAFSIDFNGIIQSGSIPTLVAGATVCAQYWYRDPPNPLGLGLTNAVRFQIRP